MSLDASYVLLLQKKGLQNIGSLSLILKRNGKYNWTMSYCGKCDLEKVKQSIAKNPDYYKEYINKYNNDYYHNNKDNIRIIQKRYYYNKLSPEKQVIYKEQLQEKYPFWVEQICV